MGLDMYLEKHSYVKNWEHTAPEDKHQITVKKGGKKRTDIKPERIKGIVEEIGYWRKANAIHEWFRLNCMDEHDNDNGGEHYVSREQLKELLEAVEKVLASSKLVKGKIANGSTLKNGVWEPNLEDGKTIENKEVAEELLPTTDGFFFGSTDYDQYYIEDLKLTEKIVKEALKDENGDFYYHASY